MLIMGQFKKRGFELTSMSSMCGAAEEDLNHILIHGPSVWTLWGGPISIPRLCDAFFSFDRSHSHIILILE